VARVQPTNPEQTGKRRDHIDDTDGPPPPGTGGVKIYRFKGLSAGQTNLEIVLRDSADEDVAPLHTFSLQVAVR
jgi:hypothetical protein